MQIVIDIPDKDYENCKMLAETIGKVLIHHSPSDRIKYFVGVGTPLPKGHGRLIDADKLEADYDWCEYEGGDIVIGYQAYSTEQIDHAPTIIEADDTESEVES
mgnify:CR=1 FL=1